MVDDVVLAKASIIERCLQRVEQEYRGDPEGLRRDLTRQDSIVLNLQRACEAAIDLGLHLVRVRRAGLPQRSRDAFDLLVTAGLLPDGLGDRLAGMVGFRNIAVHDYQKLDLDVVQAIIEERLPDLREFVRVALTAA